MSSPLSHAGDTQSVTDITVDARAIQRRAISKMSGAQRVEAAMEMSELAKQVTLDGIRSRNPNYTEAQVKRAWFVILHGEEVTETVLGPRLIDA